MAEPMPALAPVSAPRPAARKRLPHPHLPKPRQEPGRGPGGGQTQARDSGSMAEQDAQLPKQLGEELADRGVIKPAQPEAPADDPPAKDDELMNTLLGEAFQTLSKAGMNAQQKVILAKKATDKHPNEWRVSDGKKFLNYMAQEFPQ